MEKDYNFNLAFLRLQEVLGIYTHHGIGLRLGISRSAVISAVNRGMFPASWLLKMLLEHNINPNWLMYGDLYDKYMIPTTSKPRNNVNGKKGYCGNNYMVPDQGATADIANVSKLQKVSM